MNHALALPANHFAYETENTLRSIIKPLEKLYGIKYFNYGVKYPDATGYDLITHTKVYEGWFTSNSILPSSYLKEGWYFADDLVSPELLDIHLNEDVGNFLIYIEKTENKTVVYGFGTHRDHKNIKEIYRNNYKLLKRFGDYFSHYLGKNMIDMAEQRAIISYQPLSQEIAPANVNEPKISLARADVGSPLMTLNTKERCYLRYILSGFSNKEISAAEAKSEKAVFQYLSKLKQKWRCEKKSDIIEMSRQNNGISYYFPELFQQDFSETDIALFVKELYKPISRLSVQEYRCCQLLVKGCTLEEISRQLGIKIPTAADYVKRLKSKLNCSNKVELFNLLQQMGLIDIYI